MRFRTELMRNKELKDIPLVRYEVHQENIVTYLCVEADDWKAARQLLQEAKAYSGDAGFQVYEDGKWRFAISYAEWVNNYLEHTR